MKMLRCSPKTERSTALGKLGTRWLLLFILALPAMTLCSSPASAQPPIGLWTIDANGFLGDLDIQTVDAAGNLTGTAYGDSILGFWDDDAKKITFIRVIDPFDPSSFQIFTGFFFQDPLFWAGNPGDVSYTLAGYFEAFAGTGAFAKRSLYGWHAQQGIIQ